MCQLRVNLNIFNIIQKVFSIEREKVFLFSIKTCVKMFYEYFFFLLTICKLHKMFPYIIFIHLCEIESQINRQ